MSTSKTAPGRLEVVQDFVNTADLEGGTDDLAGPEDLRAWLAERDLIAPGIDLSPADLARAVEFREGLRDALEANHDGALDPRAIETINRTAAGARLVVRMAPDGSSSLVPDSAGIEGALGRLLAIVYTAMTDGTWDRLKICKRDKCRWAFYDQSKNQSGSWCSMAVCGNKEKAAAYRRRHTHA
ncbi:MAG: CGNR zinc finger domain-containing protein [Actinomycetota bacterium]